MFLQKFVICPFRKYDIYIYDKISFEYDFSPSAATRQIRIF